MGIGWGKLVANVLVVEDEEALRVIAESIVAEAGHETVTAANFTQALALLANEQTIDLLFTDIALEQDNHGGLELAVKARELRPSLRMLYTTGQAVTDGMRAMFVEGSHFIPKPYTLEALMTAVQYALQDGDPINDN